MKERRGEGENKLFDISLKVHIRKNGFVYILHGLLVFCLKKIDYCATVATIHTLWEWGDKTQREAF